MASTCVRLRDIEPVPHDLVQVDQAPKALVLQLTAQAKVLHARVSAVWPWALPPKVGSVWARLRYWEPVPHDLVQVDHAEKAEVAQLVAHAKVLQLRVSV